jgi:hypothetical protein
MITSDPITVDSMEISPWVFRAIITFDTIKAPMSSLDREEGIQKGLHVAGSFLSEKSLIDFDPDVMPIVV